MDAVHRGLPADEARKILRERVWAQVEERFSPGTRRVFIAPDGMLAEIPWCALPGRTDERFLLDEYVLGLLPYGAYLADRGEVSESPPGAADRGRTVDERRAASDGAWLLVGNVDYDRRTGVTRRDAPASDQRPFHWEPLPYTRVELDDVAESLPEAANRVRVEGAEATTDRVLQELAKCRFAHIATHAFFADPRIQAELGVDRDPARHAVVRRHPLLLNGIAFAGANLGPSRDPLGVPTDDGGVLTGNIIAHLPLAHLELVVLSGCETGAGAASGDGAVGLQRAFHLAGARNVVSTLWRVDDRSTAVLMKLFYHFRHDEHLGSLEALRQAQLAVLRDPDQAESLAALRGPDFRKAARKLVASEPRSGRLAERVWAGFAHSGPGID
ncbi:MAG: CHAT domain-containing protein [Planctomycetes bacterium]|nr:CHAT domain-containing protein [Planctomycetota bacterium]